MMNRACSVLGVHEKFLQILENWKLKEKKLNEFSDSIKGG